MSANEAVSEDYLRSPLPPFLSLPLELHQQIQSHLPWRTITTLRLVHRHFSSQILAPANLSAIHRKRQLQTYADELEHLTVTLGYSNPNWCGFTQGWGLTWGHSLSASLPCYHCLRWLPSVDATLAKSAFSRGMATQQRDLGMAKANSRVCVECGVRSGFYGRGSRVRYQSVCIGCGELGERIRKDEYKSDRAEMGVGLLKGWRLRWHWFCRRCVEAGKIPGSRIEFEHERKWGKYEKGMEAGKRYREAKGRIIRAERGIVEPEAGAAEEDDGDLMSGDAKAVSKTNGPKHECPILREKRMCLCWKEGKEGPSRWLLFIQTSPWKW